MDRKPWTRRAACRNEVCVRLGYCGGDTRWTVESDFDGDTPDDVIDAVLSVEGLDPISAEPDRRAELRAIIVDWLFDPHGRGARSGLKR